MIEYIQILQTYVSNLKYLTKRGWQSLWDQVFCMDSFTFVHSSLK